MLLMSNTTQVVLVHLIMIYNSSSIIIIAGYCVLIIYMVYSLLPASLSLSLASSLSKVLHIPAPQPSPLLLPVSPSSSLLCSHPCGSSLFCLILISSISPGFEVNISFVMANVKVKRISSANNYQYYIAIISYHYALYILEP